MLGASATTTIDPGRLAPTKSEPAFAPVLNQRMESLWRAILANDPARARSYFFPRTAYLRMKTGQIANPNADYANRLIALFDLDVTAYHQRLTSVGTPTDVHVTYNVRDAAWIAPGHCENLIGYWHLPGVRFVYRHGSRTWSVAVASLISWRGVWYVVHLGPNPRAANVGTLDDFRSGPGVPGPPGGC
jgi:hypothetical protein